LSLSQLGFVAYYKRPRNNLLRVLCVGWDINLRHCLIVTV